MKKQKYFNKHITKKAKKYDTTSSNRFKKRFKKNANDFLK
jgi:hypothetical protein